MFEDYAGLALKYGLLAVYAIIIWAVASMVGSMIGRWIRSYADKANLDQALSGFAASMAGWLIKLVAVIAILQLFGIDATSLVAVLGAATLAVGLALQGTLSNFAAGVMLLIFRPFNIGHYVEVAGHSGTVAKIDLFTTELTTVDNVQIIIPNSEVWSTSVVNYSAHDRRRLDMTIGVDYGANIEEAIRVIRTVIDADPRASGEPAPFVKATNLGDSSVDITLRVWCQAGDYWDMKFDMTQKIKESLDAAGISIPYPHIELVQKAS